MRLGRVLTLVLIAFVSRTPALAAQQPAGPDLSGTWVLNLSKSTETGRELKFDTTTFTRDGAMYKVRANFDHGHGPANDTKAWPVGSGNVSQPNSIGLVEHVITRVQGDTVSYLDEFVDQGRQFNQTTGRTWLSKDGKTRFEQFELVDVPSPVAGMFVFERK